jgi:hypothetical protein
MAPPHWDVVRLLFESRVLTERERRILLSGRSSDGIAKTGPVICACFAACRHKLRLVRARAAANYRTHEPSHRQRRLGFAGAMFLPVVAQAPGVEPASPE